MAESRNEVEILIRYMLEDKNLKVAIDGLKQLGTRLAETLTTQDINKVKEFSDGLKKMITEVESSGKRLSNSDKLLLEGMKGMSAEVDKSFPQIAKSFNDVGDAVDKTKIKVKDTNEQTQVLKDGFDKLKDTAVRAFAAIGVALTASGIFRLAEEGAKSEGLAIGLQTVAANAGVAVGAIADVAREIEALGITSNVAAENLTQLLTSGVTPDQARQLGQAASNLATAYARSTSEVFDQVTNAVSRGSTMLLQRQFGIALDAQKIYIQKAREIGRQLFEDEKKGVLADALIKEIELRTGGATAAGVDSATKKLNDLRVEMDRLKDDIGAALLPAFKSFLDIVLQIIQALNDFVTALGETRREEGEVIGVTNTLAGVFEGFGRVIIAFIEHIKENITLYKALAIVVIGFGVAFAGPIAAVAQLVLALVLFLNTSERGKAIIAIFVAQLELLILFVEKAVNGFQKATEELKLLWAAITGNDVDVEAAKKRLDDIAKHSEDIAKRVATNRAAMRGALGDLFGPAATPAKGPTGSESEDAQIGTGGKAFTGILDAANRARLLRESEAKKRADEIKTRGIEEGRIRDQQLLAHMQSEATIRRTQAVVSEEIDRNSFRDGLLTLDEYFKRRLVRLEEANEDEVAIQRQAIVNAQKEIGRASFLDPGGASVARAQANFKAAEDKMLEILAKGTADRRKLLIDRTVQEEAIQKRITDIRLQNAVAEDDTNLIARINQINQKYSEQEKALGGLGTSELEHARNLEITRARYDVAMLALQRYIDTEQDQLDMQSALVASAYNAGLATTSEALNAQNDLIRQQIALREQVIAKAKEMLAPGNQLSPADAENARRVLAQNTQDIIRLYDSIDTYGKRVQRNFTDNLTQAIDDFTGKIKSLSEVLRDFATSTANQLRNIASRNLAELATKGIVAGTGGAENSIFAKIGELLGDKKGKPDGTANNPLFVSDVARNVLGAGGVAKDDAGLQSVIDAVMEDGTDVLESLGEGIENGTEAITNGLARGEFGISTLATALANGLGGLFTFATSAIQDFLSSLASSSGGGGGGFWGILIKAAIGAFTGGGGGGQYSLSNPQYGAEGGLLLGPSHAAGGVRLEAEGGEYLIREAQTRRWLPLLNAINSGVLDSISTAIAPRRGHYFAEGGLVGAGMGGGGDVINLEINVDSDGRADAQTDSLRAQQLAKVVVPIVQAEMVRQKRPGGLNGPGGG